VSASDLVLHVAILKTSTPRVALRPRDSAHDGALGASRVRVFAFEGCCQPVGRPAATPAPLASLGLVSGSGMTVTTQVAPSTSRFGARVKVAYGPRTVVLPPFSVLPNPSLEPTHSGRPPWPGLRYAVHFLSPGQGALPPWSPQLER
jgi:hypothetical protein